MQVGMIGIPIVIVRLVVSALGVMDGVGEVRRFHGEVAVAVDAQNHAVGGAEAPAGEDRQDKHEDGESANLHVEGRFEPRC